VAADRPEEFFFIEMNTRLQVEHPVTELVTGIDLVEQQLRIAAGERLAIAQDDVRLDGHAVEARVYAESPERGFLPATGDVLVWRPAEGVRTDAAVETGSVITADYDPMIAKVISWGADRAEALTRLDSALAETIVLGVETNIAFLRTLLAQPEVVAGAMDTGLIDRMPAFEAAAPSAAALRAAGSVHFVSSRREHTNDALATRGLGESTRSGHASETWRSLPGWRVGGGAALPEESFLTDDGAIVSGVPAQPGDMVSVGARRATTRADGESAPAGTTAQLDDSGAIWVHADGATHRLRSLTRREAMERRLDSLHRATSATDPQLRSPMPGAVVAVHVADGAAVRTGDRIVTIEAMKMEHPVLAPHDGVVTLDVAVGEQVRRDQPLAHVVDASLPS
jgi:acetyl-CoA/propionyl-CoA carboxylase biotin carboxyl carrier protein